MGRKKDSKRARPRNGRLALVVLAAGFVPLGSAFAADAGPGVSGGSAGCGANRLTVGDSRHTINVNGQARSFFLHVPRNYTGATPVPLIVDYHGHGGNGEGEKNGSGFANQSETSGFIVAYPDGLGGNWNYHPDRGVDDLGFSKAIIKDLGDQGCIDKNRVYAAGFSQGGGMSYGVACYAADAFAAVVSSSYDLYDGQPCRPARPISVLSFRGTADPLARYDGSPGFYPDGRFVGAKETLKRLAAIDHCSGTPKTDSNGCEIYINCDGGTQVGLCTVNGGGHLSGDPGKSWDFLRQFSLSSGSDGGSGNAAGGGATAGDAVAAAKSGHVYKLRNVHSGKVLGVLGMSKDDGGKVLQWGDNGTRDHEWRLDLQSNGYYKLTNMNSNKVLAVLYMSTGDGGEVIQWGDNGTADHEWKFVASRGGTYKLVNRHSGKVLGVRNMSKDDGGMALQWGDNGTPDHDWTLEEVASNGGSADGNGNNGGTNNGGTNNGAGSAVAVNLSAVGGNGKVDLSWTVTGNITTVQVYRDTDANPAGRQRVAILSGKARSFTDTSVVKGTQYWYWIKYTLANGVIDNSAAASTTSGGNDSVIPVAGVTLTPSASVKVGATATLTATVQPNNASNKAVAWSTNNPSVATVSGSGVVSGIAKGNATITVTTADGNRMASSAITVTQDQPTTIPVTGVTLTPSASIKVGATATLTAMVQPNNASNKAVTWSSSNLSIATVSSSGVVTGIAKGDATITVATVDGNRKAASAITVTDDQATNFTLDIGHSVNGRTDVSAGSHSHKPGASVTITAIADSGYEFAGWSGAFMGNTNPLTITMDGNKTLTAMFTKTNGGMPPPPVRVDNPYVGADRYIDPEWSGQVKDSANRAPSDLAGAIATVAQQPTSVWLDRIAAIDGSATSMGLADHLDAALEQQAARGSGKPILIEIVVYDLPDRDCAALASNGELKIAQNGMTRYKTEYIDRIVDVLNSNPAYRNLRIVTVIEPDSLPNAVTNTGLPACTTAAPAYKEGVAYAIRKLAALDNVYIYLDMANSGWLGWEWGDKAAQVYKEVMANAGGENLVRGFTTNVSNYAALKEPFNPYDNQNQYQSLIENWYEWNRMIDEETYVNAMLGRFPNHHFLIDTSRNGWKAQAAGVPIENRVHRGNWCNNKNAGIGERPRAEPMAGVDAFVWIKPPGASDGSSDSSQAGPDAEGKGFDAMCGTADVVRSYSKGKAIPTDALSGAPAAGKWFDKHFFQLVRNATPALDNGGGTNPPTPTVPVAPSGLSATNTSTAVTLTWSDRSNDEQGFRVERRLSGAATWTTLANTAANVQRYTDSSVAAGGSYDYRVSAFNATGSSAAITTSVMVPKPVDPVPVTGITLSASSGIKVGAATTLTATVAPSNASNKAVVWSSSSTSIATVSNSGVVIGIAAGSAVITATTVDGGRTASATITVAAEVVDSTISAASTSFDKNVAKQADIAITMALNGNTLGAIRNGNATLVAGTDYTVSGSTVTLLKGYLARQAAGSLNLSFDFSAGNDPVLRLTISDSSGGGTPSCTEGDLFCEDFESFTGASAISNAWSIENDNPGNASVSIDGTHARGSKALHLSTIDNGMAFLVPTKFGPPGNSFFGRMWLWVDAFPTRPDYAHFTLVEVSGAGSGTKVRPIGGQYIPGNSVALWGVGSDGGPTGDWTSWQTTTPTAAGRWTCMEWQMDASDNAVNVWIDGMVRPELSVSTKKHGNGSSDFVFPTFNKIRLGWQLYQGGAMPHQFDIWLDDIALSSSRIGCGGANPPTPMVPATPSGLSAANANAVVTLTWSDQSNDEQGFRVERRLSGAATWTTLANTAANVQRYTDSSVAAGSSYDYRVSAFNATGSSAAITTSVMVPRPVDPAPTAPSALLASVVDNGAVNLAWTDNSGNENGFRVERRVAGTATWTMLAETAANTRTYSDAKVPMGNTYEYRVSAYNAGGSSTGATTSATLLTLVQYGEQKYKDNTVMRCAICHGADGKGIFPLKARTVGDFDVLTTINATTMPDKTGLCVGNCAKGTAAYIIKMQTGISLDENGK